MSGKVAFIGISLLALGAVTGCAGPAVDNPIAVSPEEYHQVIAASVEVLRDMRFEVDRQSHRFGVVTTQPRIAPSLAEVWHPENSTWDQMVESTINLQRRKVRVTLEPAETAPSADEPAGSEDLREYMMRVEVVIERKQTPERQLTSATFASLDFNENRAAGHEILTERGRESEFWRPIGRDPRLEQRLVLAILDRAGERPEPSRPVERDESAEPSTSPDTAPATNPAG